jgi:hypothetical protein
LSLIVVLTDLPRMTPCKPMSRISRDTVQCAFRGIVSTDFSAS